MQIMVKWTLANSVGYCAWGGPEKWKCTVHHTDEVISRHHAARMPPQQLGILWQVRFALVKSAAMHSKSLYYACIPYYTD